MLKKNEIKDIQSLRHKKFRDEAASFVAEGPKIVLELLQLIPQQCKKVYAIEGWAKQNQSLLNAVSHEIITEQELERISQLQTPNEVVSVWQQFKSNEPEPANTFCLYLDGIQDPGNFGTIIRIADWFGLKEVICGEGCADLYNAKVVQSTMASIARVNVFYDEGLNWLKKQKHPIYAAVLGGQSIYEENKTNEGILIIGNESRGIQAAVLSMATEKITIPRRGEAESLNAGVATGIILSHLIK